MHNRESKLVNYSTDDSLSCSSIIPDVNDLAIRFSFFELPSDSFNNNHFFRDYSVHERKHCETKSSRKKDNKDSQWLLDITERTLSVALQGRRRVELLNHLITNTSSACSSQNLHALAAREHSIASYKI